MKEKFLLSGKAFKNQLVGLIKGEKCHTWGKRVGVDRGVIDRIFKKEKVPDPKNLIKLSNILGQSIDFLLTGKEHIDYYDPSEKEYIGKFTEIFRDGEDAKSLKDTIDRYYEVHKLREGVKKKTSQAG